MQSQKTETFLISGCRRALLANYAKYRRRKKVYIKLRLKIKIKKFAVKRGSPVMANDSRCAKYSNLWSFISSMMLPPDTSLYLSKMYCAMSMIRSILRPPLLPLLPSQTLLVYAIPINKSTEIFVRRIFRRNFARTSVGFSVFFSVIGFGKYS